MRALAVGAVPVMWSRVRGWERIVPGPYAAVFVEDFGFDAVRLAQALEAEAEDEQAYMLVRTHAFTRHARTNPPHPSPLPAATVEV